MTTFTDLGVPARLVSTLAQRGIEAPFPIQTASIPDALAGRDILGKAPTGSGKTLAFGLPLITMVGRSKPNRPRALVLAPTRELAEQISQELIPLARRLDRWVLAIYGGVGYEFQRRNLRRGADIVVATPGRLIDLMEDGSVLLDQVDIVVVDEADRMADMGFMPQVRAILDQTNDERQTILFSATLDGDVDNLRRTYQRDPVLHEVESEEDYGDALHYFWEISHADRVETTARILESTASAIVFTRTRHGADRVARQLERSGLRTASIHGGRTQAQRTRALREFSSGKVKALVATDVAARGIHVDAVSAVVHFDLAADAKDYLHRSGRTARGGQDGVVVTLVTAQQRAELGRLQGAVGVNRGLHDPMTDWLTGATASRVGELPSERSSGSRTPTRNRNRSRNQNQTQNRSRNRSQSRGRRSGSGRRG